MTRLQLRIEPDAIAGAWSLDALGAIPVDFAVAEAVIGGPARGAGLQEGDIPFALDGRRITSLEQMQGLVQESEGRSLAMRVLRDGQLIDVSLTPQPTVAGPEDKMRWQLGIMPTVPTRGAEQIRERTHNPLVALSHGIHETGRIVSLTAEALWKLATARMGFEAMSGPIGIGQIAVQAFNEPGWFTFLYIFALISINLGVFNLLPVPALDGGQIVFAALEAIKGSPLGMRAREVSQGIGFAAIAALMGIAFWNDLVRNWEAISGFFSDLL
jgi:regulator of sigma E protease